MSRGHLYLFWKCQSLPSIQPRCSLLLFKTGSCATDHCLSPGGPPFSIELPREALFKPGVRSRPPPIINGGSHKGAEFNGVIPDPQQNHHVLHPGPKTKVRNWQRYVTALFGSMNQRDFLWGLFSSSQKGFNLNCIQLYWEKKERMSYSITSSNMSLSVLFAHLRWCWINNRPVKQSVFYEWWHLTTEQGHGAVMRDSLSEYVCVQPACGEAHSVFAKNTSGSIWSSLNRGGCSGEIQYCRPPALPGHKFNYAQKNAMAH